jgi:serine/threonine-protein kinase RsbW
MGLVTSTFPAMSSSAAAARAWIRSQLMGSAEDSATEVVLLVLSELVTNAYRHGEGTITVSLQVDPGCVRLRVEDFGSVFEPPEPGGPLGETGRGLVLVQALSAAWGIDPGEDGKVVWAEIALGHASIPEGFSAG